MEDLGSARVDLAAIPVGDGSVLGIAEMPLERILQVLLQFTRANIGGFQVRMVAFRIWVGRKRRLRQCRGKRVRMSLPFSSV